MKDSIKRLKETSGSLIEAVDNGGSPELSMPKPNRRSPRLTNKENNPDTPKSLSQKSMGMSKKKVSFGEALSPEYFDKRLPPITPVRFGQSPLGTPKEKDRRRSDPLRQKALMLSAAKKRMSIGTVLSTVPIAEEDNHHESAQELPPLLPFNLGDDQDVFEDSPNTKLNLPSPLKAEIVNPLTEPSVEKLTHLKKKRMSTPIRKEIEDGVRLKKKRLSSDKVYKILEPRKPSLSTPKRKKLSKTLRKSATPGKDLRKRKSTGAMLKDSLSNDDDHHSRPHMEPSRRKSLQHVEKSSLHRTLRTGLKTPIRQQIKQGILIILICNTHRQ